MKAFFASCGRRNVSCRLLSESVEIFRRKEFGEKLKISLLSMREYLKWFVKAETAYWQQVLAVLKTKRKTEEPGSLRLSLQG